MEENKFYGFERETKKKSSVFFFVFALVIPICLGLFFYYYAPRHGLNLREILLSLIVIQAFIVLVLGIIFIYVRKFRIRVSNNKLEIESLFSKKAIPLSNIIKYGLYSRIGTGEALLLYTIDGKRIAIDDEIEEFNEWFEFFKKKIPCNFKFEYSFFRKGILAMVIFLMSSYVFALMPPRESFYSFILNLSPVHLGILYFIFLFWKSSFSISFTDTFFQLKRPFIKSIIFSWQNIKDRGKVELKYERRFIWDIWVCTITLDNKKIVFDKFIDNGEELLKIVAEKTNSPFLSA
ncbi:MAG: hypothetical protein Q8O13_00025 [Candidatus Omnitrophota bacterium]|nr:hypothetical protein [Candidatus Omnitrophota bacterium]